MRKLIAWLCVAGAALCIANLTWAASPTSQSVIERDGICDISVGQTAAMAADVIDTTTTMDIRALDWGLDNAADLLYLNARLTSQTMAAGESLTVTVDVSADGTVWDTDASMSQVLTGTQTLMVQLVEWGRFFRIRILNQDDDAHDYDILLSAPAR